MPSVESKWARRGIYSLIMGCGAFFAYFNSKHGWVTVPEYNRIKGFWLEPLLPALEPYLPSIILALGVGFVLVGTYCVRRYAITARSGGPAA